MRNRFIKLTKLRLKCGAHPTYYTGKTVSGQDFEAYLKDGWMNITVDDISIVNTNPENLDSVCSFERFKDYARMYGFIIDESEAEESSDIEDMNTYFEELYEKNHRVEFIQDFYSKTVGKTYKKGESYMAEKELAKLLVANGLAKIIR